MNGSENAGEASCKAQENGDGSCNERPLKKARFAWQVKGKYHLKNEVSDCVKPSAATEHKDHVELSPETEKESNSLVGNTEQNLELLGDYLLKQDFNTLDSVITDPDKSLLTPSTSLSGDQLPYPRYVSTSCHSSRSRRSSSEHVLVPMSMVTCPSHAEDQCIARWQARQMAKGFVDNTINRALDSWMVTPLQNERENNCFLALDVAEFINNLPGDNSIENEGILMAISAHGLQNTSSSSSNVNANEDTNSSKDDIFVSPPSSPLRSEDGAQVQFTNHRKHDDSSSGLDVSWSCTDEARENDLNNILSPNSSYQYFNDDLQTANVDYDGDYSPNESDMLDNHFDFLDAAVSFAIQNKGLSFGTDYG